MWFSVVLDQNQHCRAGICSKAERVLETLMQFRVFVLGLTVTYNQDCALPARNGTKARNLTDTRQKPLSTEE